MPATSLGRTLSARHPASAWALASATIVLVGAGLEHGWHSGLRGALSVILAWALVRELAPLRVVPSLLAPFAAVAYAIPAETDLLACVGMLLAVRITARTVGDVPTVLDCIVLVPVVCLLALRPAALPTALVLAAATYACSSMVRLRLTGVVMLVAALTVGIVEGTITPHPAGWDDRSAAGRVLVVSVAILALHLVRMPLPRWLSARDDRGISHLSGTRIRSARVVAVLGLLATGAWIGVDSVFVLSCVSAGIVAAGIPSARMPAASDTLRT